MWVRATQGKSGRRQHSARAPGSALPGCRGALRDCGQGQNSKRHRAPRGTCNVTLWLLFKAEMMVTLTSNSELLGTLRS